MSEIGYTEATWFHAANTAHLVERALTDMSAALTRFTEHDGGAADSHSADHPEMITFGIEVDSRVVYQRHRQDEADQGWVAILHHDPFSTEELNDAREASALRSDWCSLEQLFALIVNSPWFRQQEARHSQRRKARSLQSGKERLFRLIIKLDFKDPRAAEIFHRHARVESGVASSGTAVWACYQRVCALLVPHGELSVWWNADVVPSALLLHAEQNGANEDDAGRPHVEVSSTNLLDRYDIDAYPSLRFIDIPQSTLVHLIHQTVVMARTTDSARAGHPVRSVALSLGWVLKLPSRSDTADAHDVYASHAPYRSEDVERMKRFVTRLWAALSSTPEVVPELVTFAVLWEAVFTPQKLLASLLSLAGADEEKNTEEDKRACSALIDLMQHTQNVLGDPAAAATCDSPRGFLTFWKVNGSASRLDTRAREYFPWCTIDG